MSLAHGYYGIFDLHVDGGPEHPIWSRSVQGTGYTMLDGGNVAAYYIGPIAGPPTRGLFAVFGEQAVLEAWNLDAMPGAEVLRRRNEGAGISDARKIYQALTHLIVDDDGENSVRREVTPPNSLTLPTPGVPWGMITALRTPSTRVTLAGHPLFAILEDEPDRDP